jgi:hypothetical protein
MVGLIPVVTRLVTASQDHTLRARVLRSHALHYHEGADASTDRPAHVRASSGVVWAGSRLVVIQDDANFVALVSPDDGVARAVALPAGAGGLRQFDDARGNKKDKLDLEALVRVPAHDDGTMLLALASGSKKRRDAIIIIRGAETHGDEGPAVQVTLYRVPAFYAALRDANRFAGSALNVEGAVYVGGDHDGVLRLFNRGNGKAKGEFVPVNASCDVNWAALQAHLESPETIAPPEPRRVRQYDLGAVGGLALTFTDATLLRPRCTVYTAAAEASPDVTRDGPVVGCAIGVLTESGDDVHARWAPLVDGAGALYGAKIEGIALHQADPSRAWVVVDRDDHATPSELCEVALEGPWFGDAADAGTAAPDLH